MEEIQMTSVAKATTLEDALAAWDRSKVADAVAEAESLRLQAVERFPIQAWPEMPLERYALGTDQSEDSYCYWLEFRTRMVGSISGGSAHKHLMFRQRSDGRWSYPTGFADEQGAWRAIRAAFVQAFELAAGRSFADIDALQLAGGPALRTKSIYLYFPDELLPIFSTAHLQHFIRHLGREPDAGGAVTLNRSLLELVRANPAFRDWTGHEVMRFLYDWVDPHDTRRIVKIAPGQRARLWEECRRGGYISVGWTEVGDLRQFAGKDDFQKRFVELYSSGPAAAGSQVRKASELWTLMELEPGDLVLANRGTSEVVGIGTVVAPGYQWRPELSDHKHTVSIDWTDTRPRRIDPVPSWATQTVAPIGAERWQRIRAARGRPDEELPVLDPLHLDIRAALLARGQVILYGPPGTGKTYVALQFAKWLQLHPLDDSQVSTEREPAVVEVVTFHPSYSYEDFIEGYRPVDGAVEGLRLELVDGIFKKLCERADKERSRPHLLVIDEINRGNIPKVFGELITLLERDKRDRLETLPSGRTFSVPPNLYVIGTMNTADRSIRLLDAALRRRFAFIEVAPNHALLEGASIGTMRLDQFLQSLNRRILTEAGRERLVGHSYLLRSGAPLTDAQEFSRVFRQELLPLLEEFCFDDYARLQRIIGSQIVDAEEQQVDGSLLNDPDRLVAALANHLRAGATDSSTT
jgi:5-methylcytosine-specific restriction protein B